MNPVDRRSAEGGARLGDEGTMLRDVLRGLSGHPRSLPPKYFYDHAGSLLFERITELPEYYLTRAESALLVRHADALCDLFGPEATLIELGSGSSAKTTILLDRARTLSRYVPVDISGEHLRAAAQRLRTRYPGLAITPMVADFSRGLPPMARRDRRAVAFFPGSSIGNFEPEEARALLCRLGEWVGAGGLIIIGVDMPKPAEVLEPAYDDRTGVTALFNKNMLVRINHELGANFDVGSFAHRAVWQPDESRIEMRLVCRRAQRVRIAGRELAFDEGESIVTEHCYKWSPERFVALAADAGLRSVSLFFDPDEQVSMHVLAPSR